MGIEVLRGRGYCKEVVLWQCEGIRALLTIRSRIGLSGDIALAAIKEAGVTIFR